MMNRNKRGVALNLRSDEGCAALADLIGALASLACQQMLCLVVLQHLRAAAAIHLIR